MFLNNKNESISLMFSSSIPAAVTEKRDITISSCDSLGAGSDGYSLLSIGHQLGQDLMWGGISFLPPTFVSNSVHVGHSGKRVCLNQDCLKFKSNPKSLTKN